MFSFVTVSLAAALAAAPQPPAAPAKKQAPVDSATLARRAQAAAEAVTVHFRNDGTDLATVYALSRSGLRVRLGQVSPGDTVLFKLPRSVVASDGTVSLVAAPFARRRTISSGQFVVGPGDTFEAGLSGNGNTVWVLPAR